LIEGNIEVGGWGLLQFFFLIRVEFAGEENSDNYTIRFVFKPNEYFENEVLSVKFWMLDDNEVERIDGTEVKWKEGKDITKKTVVKKVKNKKTGKSKIVTKVVDNDSFFHFFETIPEIDDDLDEDLADALLDKMDRNSQIAKTIEEELIPYHLEYYLGVREDLDDEDDEDMDEKDNGIGEVGDNNKKKEEGGKKKGKDGDLSDSEEDEDDEKN